MAKGQDAKKNQKTKSEKTLKEKRKEKKAKKEGKYKEIQRSPDCAKELTAKPYLFCNHTEPYGFQAFLSFILIGSLVFFLNNVRSENREQTRAFKKRIN